MSVAPPPSTTAAASYPVVRDLLGGVPFRRLLAVRLTTQLADGGFEVALASLFFFSPERATTAGGIALAFAVLTLPFTLVGPWAGVVLDRWSRRNTLAVGNLARAVAGARHRRARGRRPGRARALRPRAALRERQPVPARRAVGRPAARGRRPVAGHRQRGHADARDGGRAGRQRPGVRRPPGRAVLRPAPAAGRRRAGGRRAAHAAADRRAARAGPVTCGQRPGRPHGPAGPAPAARRRARPGRRAAAPARAAYRCRRPRGDVGAPVHLRGVDAGHHPAGATPPQPHRRRRPRPGGPRLGGRGRRGRLRGCGAGHPRPGSAPPTRSGWSRRRWSWPLPPRRRSCWR